MCLKYAQTVLCCSVHNTAHKGGQPYYWRDTLDVESNQNASMPIGLLLLCHVILVRDDIENTLFSDANESLVRRFRRNPLVCLCNLYLGYV